jgi:hypothetical protein
MKGRNSALALAPTVFLALVAIAVPGARQLKQGATSHILDSAENNSKQLI